MSVIEVDAVLNQYYKNYKNQWEQTRLIAFYCAAPFAKIKLEDVIKFTWDKQAKELSPEELQARKQKLLDFVKDLKNLREFNPLLSNE